MRKRSPKVSWRALVLKLLRVHVDHASTAPIWARVASQAHIVCANHVSLLDGIVIALASPVPLTFAVDSVYARHSLIARLGLALLSKAGLGSVVSMDASAPFGLRALRRALAAGHSVMVFPEGHVSPTGRPQPLRPGLIWLHRATDAPVVWFRLAGAEQSRWFAKSGRWWWPRITLSASSVVLIFSRGERHEKQVRENVGNSSRHEQAVNVQTKLNTIQFLALRSIARESWDMQRGRIQWRFNGKWVYLFRRYGVRAPLSSVDGLGGHCGYDDVFNQAWDAAYQLEARGLVEVFTIRCCPDTVCHANDRHEFRLTARGTALLQKANATSQQHGSTEYRRLSVPPVDDGHGGHHLSAPPAHRT